MTTNERDSGKWRTPVTLGRGLLLVPLIAADATVVPVSRIVATISRARIRRCPGKAVLGNGGGDCDGSEEESSEHAECVHDESWLFVCGFISVFWRKSV